MQWVEGIGWPVDPYEVGVPYDQWLASALTEEIDRCRRASDRQAAMKASSQSGRRLPPKQEAKPIGNLFD